MRADRDPTIASLRRLKGAKYSVVLSDGTEKQLVLSTKANKWEQLARVLESMQWVSIQVLDGNGAVLGVVENDEDYDTDDDGDPVIAQTTAMARIITQVIGQTMQETRKMFADAMTAQSRLVESVITSVQTLQESYQLALTVQRSAMVANSGGGEEPEGAQIMEMLKMAMMLKAGGAPAITINPPPKPPQPPKPPTVPNGKG